MTCDWFFASFAFVTFVAFVAFIAFIAWVTLVAFIAFVAFVALDARRFKVLCSMFEVHTVTVTVTTKVQGSRLEVRGWRFKVRSSRLRDVPVDSFL